MLTTGNKVLKKVNGKWVAVALMGLLSMAAPVESVWAANEEVLA